MSLLSVLTKIFGNKASRDMREIQPYVEQIKQAYEQIDLLSNDDLRARTKALQHQVQHCADDIKAEIQATKEKIETLPIEERESHFNHIDKLEKEVLDRME